MADRSSPSRVDPAALLIAIVRSTDDAIISTDLQRLITSWNPAAERLYGYSADDALGAPNEIIIPSDRVAEEDTTVERLRTTYSEHAERAANELGDRDVETEDSSEAYAELRAMTLAAERDAIIQLRREGKLSGDAARRLQHELDLAESRLRS